MTRAAEHADGLALANRRPLPPTEFRVVEMRIRGGYGRRLRLAVLRVVAADVARTLTCVLEPRGLRAVSYLLAERRGRAAPESLDVFLPTSGGVCRMLAPERQRDRLLGADFAYQDVRAWLPEEGQLVDRVDRQPETVVFHSRCRPELAHVVRQGPSPYRVHVETATGRVTRIEYADTAERECAREFRTDAWALVDGFSVPAALTMIDARRGSRTTLHLERAWCGRDVDAGLVSAADRRDAPAILESM